MELDGLGFDEDYLTDSIEQALDIQTRNYLKYRGKCKELSEKACAENPDLTLVRGYYHCPFWGRQSHWWTKDNEGKIFDPTKDQFPSRGMGEYEEFDGYLECSNCGKRIHESEGSYDSNYVFCSNLCHGRFVGVY
jgi:hypothetical protein